MCTGNEIKLTPGDAVDCSADPPCDGVTGFAAANHNHCGKLLNQFRLLTEDQMFFVPTRRTTLITLVIKIVQCVK